MKNLEQSGRLKTNNTMIKPLNTFQKIIAYSSLLFVFVCTVFGVFSIWVILTNE